jgi:transcriptional regulator with XRE-family HTH domain
VANEDPERLLRAVAHRIAELRSGRGLTQEQVAESLGIALRNFQRIEGGRQNLTIRTMAAIASVLGVRVIEFFQPGEVKSEVTKPQVSRRSQPRATRRRT